jgi:sorbitol/mannitol transport system permease protein
VDILKPNIFPYIVNSGIVSVVSALLAMVIGVMASYRIVFTRMSEKQASNMYFWFLSTQILPPCAILIPLYLIFKYLNLLDTQWGLIILYTGFFTPLVVWLVTAFMKDIPQAVIEAADIDGISRIMCLLKIIIPISRAGIFAAALFAFIFIWNEFFLAVNLTNVKAATLPVFMGAHMKQQGLSWAHLSAVCIVSIIPPVIIGSISQKTIIKGLLAGSTKG